MLRVNMLHLPRMSEVLTVGVEHIPQQACMIFPNRVNPDVVRALEQTLGAERLAWLVHYDDPKPDEEVMQHLTAAKAAGGWVSMRRMSPEMLSERVHDLLKTGRHVVLLPARLPQQAASLSDISAPLLKFLDNSTLPVLPVYAGMYGEGLGRAVCTEAPYDKMCVQFMPLQAAGAATGARVRGAWMEAAAEQFGQHPLLQRADLGLALRQALRAHPNARLIDGVDDSDINFETLLVFALLAAKQLTRVTLASEVGILLPPGKLCVIANLACLFAGIVPVNFNYTATAETFRAQVKLSGVTRFITEHRFTLKQHTFAWPRKLDQIFIDDLLRNINSLRVKTARQLVRWGKEKLFGPAARKTQATDPLSTASIFFTKSPGNQCKGIAATHRMLVAGAAQMQSRLQLKPGERVLAVTPFYEPYGFMAGFILPILCGLDIVTYPDMRTPTRIGVLCGNFGPALGTFTVPACYELAAAAGQEAFAPMQHFIVAGARIPAALQEKAAHAFGLALHNAYTPAECSAPVAFGMNPPQEKEGKAYIPADAAGTAGCPLVGTAVRIVDTENPARVLPTSATGVIWLRSAALPSSYLGSGREAEAANAAAFRDGWFCTGDVGSVDGEGMLHIYGRSTRFSKVGGVVTSHEMVEEVILSVLKQETAGARKIAIVPDGDRLVLLSTIHRNAGPQDVLTLRYAIANARYSIPWPDKIIAVRSIPLLPNGQPDYQACLAIVQKAMNKR